MRGLAIVTGASGGIGEALADELARAGYDLLLIARSKGLLDNVAHRLADQYDIKAETMDLDLARPGAADQVLNRLDGRVPDVLVNNAGYGLTGGFDVIDRQNQQGMIDLNITALTDLTRVLINQMIKGGGSAEVPHRGIINIASTAAFQPGPLMAVYYASKAYVLSLSEALGYELAPHGLKVLAICPGPVSTGFQERAEFSGQIMLKLMPVMTAGQVASRGYKAFAKGKAVVVPGFVNWLMSKVATFTPNRLLLPIMAQMNKGRH